VYDVLENPLQKVSIWVYEGYVLFADTYYNRSAGATNNILVKNTIETRS